MSDVDSSAGKDSAAQAQLEKTGLLYRNAALAFAVNVFSAALVALVNVSLESSRTIALLWWVVVVFAAGGRFLLARRFSRARPQAAAAMHWQRRYIIATMLIALPWGLGAMLFLWNGSDDARLFTALVLIGMVAGAVPMLAPVPRAFLSFALLLCVPVAAVTLLQAHSALQWSFGIATLVFLGAVLASARYLHQTLDVAIQLGLEKGRLLENLERAGRAAGALRDSDQKLRALYKMAPVGLALARLDGRFLDFNEAFEKICGYSGEELKTLDYWKLTPPEYAQAEAHQLESLQKIGRYGPYEKEYLRKDGTRIPLRLNGMLIPGNDGQPLIWSIVEDITDRKKIESDLRVAASAFDAQVGIVVTDRDWNILRVNQAITEITGYANSELVGQSTRLLRSDRHDEAFYAAMLQSIEHTGSWQGEIWERRKDGEVYPKWMSVSAVKGEDGEVTHYVSTQYDITDRKAAEDEIRFLAFYDPLTRLPNRRLLLERLRQSMSGSIRDHRLGALLFIDLDNFKSLNDTLGHDRGDLLLQQVAQRLSSSLREHDTVARLGGDEFVVLAGNLSEKPAEAAQQAETIGHKLAAAFHRSFVLGNDRYRCTASIGVTIFGNQLASIDDLLKQADLAMYQAKASGRDTLRFFDPRMQSAVAERVSLESELRVAIRKGQFVLHFQPQLDAGGRVTGAEILVRWVHPERGLISPNEFIPLAEETGLILPLGHWVLTSACAQLVQWALLPQARHLRLSVNVSARQIRQRDFVQQVSKILEASGADPTRLTLEITESLLMSNMEETAGKLKQLRVRGMGVALDDFGTGFSSLSYLRQLPLETLKIDRSFVMDVLTDANDAAIARTIVALAQNLGLTVVAEGVETAEQRDFLIGIGCQGFQGYLFGRPVPLEEFESRFFAPAPVAP